MSEKSRPLLGVLGCLLLVAGVVFLAALAGGLASGEVGGLGAVVNFASFVVVSIGLVVAGVALMKAGSVLGWTWWLGLLRAVFGPDDSWGDWDD